MTTSLNRPIVGLIGLGEMGLPIARNLALAGYPVHGTDLNPERLAAAAVHGVQSIASIPALLTACDVILTSLPSSDAFVQVAETQLLPNLRPGQIVIDLGTVTPPETRRLAILFVEQGAALLDAPLSGGETGARRADLSIFVGGDRTIFELVRPILETIGGAEKLTYCGPSGSGQVVKGVNQLMMGLSNAAYLESLAFGVRAGVDAAILEQAIGTEGRFRADFHAVAQPVAAGDGANVGVKFRELPYFLHEAGQTGFDLPLTTALYEYIADGERVAYDDHRQAPSFWHELNLPRQEPSR